MNTTITRDIITDLLPVYLSGEASTETKALVESYMKEEPDFARLVKCQAKVVFPNNLPPLRSEHELRTLHETKRRLRHRSWHLGLAIFFTCYAIAFRFGPEGFVFMWQVSPKIAVTAGVLGLIFWTLYLTGHGRRRETGL